MKEQTIVISAMNFLWTAPLNNARTLAVVTQMILGNAHRAAQSSDVKIMRMKQAVQEDRNLILEGMIA